MLHIILTILKIIGILILIVLALFLVMIGVVLFVPIRYRAKGKKDEEGFFVKAEVYWLLHLFRIKAVYPEPGRIIVKVLCFTVYDSGKEKTKKSAKKKKVKEQTTAVKKKEKPIRKEASIDKKEEALKETNVKTQAEKRVEAQAEKKAEKQAEAQTEKKAEKQAETQTETQAEKQTEEQAETQAGTEKGKIGQVIDRIKAILQKVLDIIKNIRYTIARFCDKIKEIWANIQYYIEVFQAEETKRAFLMCKQQLYKIWKNIRPTKCKAELKIGTGEPDTTGYILALHGMLYPLIGNNVMIEPDFENQVIEGSFFVKGRITIFVLICVAVKLYFDEDIRHFLKRFKREEKINGR